MDKAVITVELSEAAKRYKEETYQRLLKEPHVKAWLKQHDLPASFVYEHTGKFSDWLKVKKRCDHCAGFAYCTQECKGRFLDLYMDGFLDFTLRHCSYFQAYESSFSHSKYYLESKLSEEQLLIDISHLDITKETNAYKLNVAHIAGLLSHEQPLKGLYLWGKPGAGKTYLACGITNFYTKQKRYAAMVNVPKLISDLKMLFHDHEAMELKLHNLQKVPVLVLDDIGGESITTWSRDEVLLPLLDVRMEHKRLTCFTSNYNPAELKERYVTTSNNISEPMAAERLLERITTLAESEYVKGESRRK